MLALQIEEQRHALLDQMEENLAYLAMYWRSSPDESEEANLLESRYRAILICMIELGLDHPLDMDSELPNARMPQEYFDLFKQV